MTSETFIDEVAADNQTALSRLGSSKALFAYTDGDLEDSTVLRAAADAEFHAAETYRQWAAADAAAADAWAETAAEERDHYDSVLAVLETEHTPGEPPPIHVYLREQTTTATRIGAFIGRTLAASRSKDQYTGYFVGQANPQLADLFRELGTDLEDQRDRAESLLETYSETDADYDAAATAATAAIQTAYEDYVDTLEGLGVNPKPVC
ncbi:MAG: rubrerythrin family protein [Halobacteriaceae archaeon]